MYSSVNSATLLGIDCHVIQIEIDVSQGLPCFQMIGMLGSEVKESRERVRVALKNAGIRLPAMNINVSLSPADLRKEGNTFDFPIALGMLMAFDYIPYGSLDDAIVVGELGLDGELKPVRGVLPIVRMAHLKGFKKIILPKENEKEASVTGELTVIGVKDILQAYEYFNADDDAKDSIITPVTGEAEILSGDERMESVPDFAEVTGQEMVKRAAEIAASGFHHMLMVGPPGSGKTMIAKRIPGIMPPLCLEESLEVSAIYSIAGLLNSTDYLIKHRPFYSPHHTVTATALTGGGRIPKPGLISLAHRGVLFMDELTEFSKDTLETLRQPLEDRRIQVSRNGGTFMFPADFMLVAAMNPCPCGYFPNMQKCNCRPQQIRQYMGRISGPILDRIDICVEAPGIELGQLIDREHPRGGFEGTKAESSESIRQRVMAARDIQIRRFKGLGITFNSEMGITQIERFCRLGAKEKSFLKHFVGSGDLSARGYHRVLKVARTIADLESSENIKEYHLAEALCYKSMDDKYSMGGPDGR